MKRTNGLRILSAALLLGSGTLCAAPQGADRDPPFGGPAPAVHGEQHPPCPPMPNREQLKHAGATDAQIQALTDAEFSLREKQIDLRAQAEKAGLALERLMSGTNADEKAVMAAADAMNQAHGELVKLELSAQLKRKQILGDELLRKLHDMRPPERPANPQPGTAGPGAAGEPNDTDRPAHGRTAHPMPNGGQPPAPPAPRQEGE